MFKKKKVKCAYCGKDMGYPDIEYPASLQIKSIFGKKYLCSISCKFDWQTS